MYEITGTSTQINIGPTALLSLLTFTYTNGTSPDFAVLLCLTSGLVQLVAGTLQLGFLVEFVSLPVVSGFTSAAAVTIASSQVKGLLGLKFSAETFIATWKEMYHHIGDTRLPDTLLSLACCIVLLGMKALKDIHIGVKDNEKSKKGVVFIQKSLWFAGVSRNAVVVILAAAVAFFVYLDVGNPLILTGKITPGLPAPQAPPFHTMVGNVTISGGGMLAQLGSGLLVVPLVGIISNVAIAKAFSNGKTLDATQEIIALGVCNVVGAFFHSFPVNGSFTRSAVSDASGVRTPAAGFVTGIIVLLTLALLTPYFYFIPRAALSAVIVCAVLHMVDIDIIKKIWKSNRLDIIPLLGTFVCCLALGIELGLICGVGVDVLLLLYYNSRPPLDVKYIEEENLPPHYSIHPVGNLHFAGAEKVRLKLSSLKNDNKATLKQLTIVPGANDGVLSNGAGSQCNGGASNATGRDIAGRRSSVLVIHCDCLYRLDYTFLQSINMLVAEWSRSGRVVWCDARPLVREQLSAVLPDAVFCDTQQLPVVLADASSSADHSGVSDTQL
ncbi:sodium-independent sulfate anion transporter-like isoform X1 [Cydia amplana]|uniref:sodium-independent sulfate anion transporter-like isoform X1 n=1 Tax=Cydia amplana TaxID=1869771 RepID=UPI002FE55B9F